MPGRDATIDPKARRVAYLHIPFCARVCPYCDFAVVAGRDDLAQRYVDALITEIEAGERWGRLTAVFIGGGTPSRLDGDAIGSVISALARRHGIERGAEITLESNPEDLDDPRVESLVAAGITRLSIGAQSLDAGVLSALGREHSPAEVRTAVSAAKVAGLESVNLDLIFGHPSETDASWSATLDGAIQTGVEHISTYALTVERGTALSRAISAGAPAPDQDVQADRYEDAIDRLGDNGYTHYEVSNFAKPGEECRYNLAVWDHDDYLAYGLGAHGFRNGVRFRNVRALDAYLTRVETGASPRQGEDLIIGWDRQVERLMIGVRMRAGVRAGTAGVAFAESDSGRRLVDAGILELQDDVLRVVDPLFTDTVAREILGLSEPGARTWT